MRHRMVLLAWSKPGCVQSRRLLRHIKTLPPLKPHCCQQSSALVAQVCSGLPNHTPERSATTLGMSQLSPPNPNKACAPSLNKHVDRPVTLSWPGLDLQFHCQKFPTCPNNQTVTPSVS